MTSAGQTTVRASASMDAHTASVLSSVANTVGLARAVLAGGDPTGASSEMSRLLHHVAALLDDISCSAGQDPETWSLVSALRDEIAGYLLAASALEETGVAPAVTLALLRRGADQAHERLDRLASRRLPPT